MIIVYHTDDKIISIDNADSDLISNDNNLAIRDFILALAKEYSNEIIVWCDERLKKHLNISEIQNLFHHHKMMLSYNPNSTNFFDNEIGYVETTPFINVNKKVSYPTWQMSSLVGAVHASVLIALKEEKTAENNFDYFLSSLAKLAMPLGLLCYSEPRLLTTELVDVKFPRANTNTLFRFVKEHYRSRWVFLLLLNLIIYEKRFPVIAFFRSLFFKKKMLATVFENVEVRPSKDAVLNQTIDVVIPTIGRKKYLYDILKDLSEQTLLPEKIIIVEQNPDERSQSELDYLTNESWPFVIEHVFTHQAGACNARNLALEQITSEWVFFADDDIRIESDFIKKALDNINLAGAKAVSICCLQEGEKQIFNTVFQWDSFGSGCSFVLAESLKNCKFSMGFEFGFGEDSDFGRQLRNQGCDILYLPEPKILHLKAPIGGFRTKPVLSWQNDLIQPKPSPTVMLSLVLHQTKEQVLGYKTTLFFKYYKHQKIKNPIAYFFNFRKQWDRSVFWANELNKK